MQCPLHEALPSYSNGSSQLHIFVTGAELNIKNLLFRNPRAEIFAMNYNVLDLYQVFQIMGQNLLRLRCNLILHGVIYKKKLKNLPL